MDGGDVTIESRFINVPRNEYSEDVYKFFVNLESILELDMLGKHLELLKCWSYTRNFSYTLLQVIYETNTVNFLFYLLRNIEGDIKNSIICMQCLNNIIGYTYFNITTINYLELYGYLVYLLSKKVNICNYNYKNYYHVVSTTLSSIFAKAGKICVQSELLMLLFDIFLKVDSCFCKTHANLIIKLLSNETNGFLQRDHAEKILKLIDTNRGTMKCRVYIMFVYNLSMINQYYAKLFLSICPVTDFFKFFCRGNEESYDLIFRMALDVIFPADPYSLIESLNISDVTQYMNDFMLTKRKETDDADKILISIVTFLENVIKSYPDKIEVFYKFFLYDILINFQKTRLKIVISEFISSSINYTDKPDMFVLQSIVDYIYDVFVLGDVSQNVLSAVIRLKKCGNSDINFDKIINVLHEVIHTNNSTFQYYYNILTNLF